MVFTAISVPLLTKHYGPERFGLLMTVTSISGLLGFADLGMGNGLINAISEAHGTDNPAVAKRYVSGSFYLLLCLTVFLCIIFTAIYPITDWAGLLNAHGPAAVKEIGPAILAFAAFFFLNIPLGIVQRIRIGYQESYANSLWLVVGNIFSLSVLFMVVGLKGSLAWVVAAVMASSVIAGLLNALSLFGYSRPWLRPKRENLDLAAGYQVLKAGLAFFFLQLGTAATFATDNIVIARILGNPAVAEYSICNRLFSVIPMVQNLLLAPLWPAYREALLRNELDWIRRWLKRSLMMTTTLSLLPSMILIIVGDKIVYYWTGKLIMPPRSLLVALGMATVSFCFGNTLGTFLNAADLIRSQVKIVALLGGVSLIGKILIASVLGLPGIGMASCVAFTFVYVAPYARLIRSFLRKLSQAKNTEAVSGTN